MSGAQRVLRWQVPVDDQEHEMHPAGPVLAVAATEGLYAHVPSHWVEFWTLDPEKHPDDGLTVGRVFRVFGTGQLVPSGWVWRGTCARQSGLVWHLFERLPDGVLTFDGPVTAEQAEAARRQFADRGVHVRVDFTGVSEDEIVRALRWALRRRGGGDVQAVLGSR